MDLTLNLIMMMPAAFKKRLLRGNDIHRDNRTMNPGMQIVLSILEQRGITNNISSLEPKAIRDLYDKVAERLQKGPPRIKHQDHQIDVNNGSIIIREYFPKMTPIMDKLCCISTAVVFLLAVSQHTTPCVSI